MPSLTYTLVVNKGPAEGDQQRRVLRLAQALARSKHHLRRVFFYGDGVSTALPDNEAAAARWQTLVDLTNNQLELLLCSASVERLGVHEVPGKFIIVGLGSLMEAGLDSDRVLNCD